MPADKSAGAVSSVPGSPLRDLLFAHVELFAEAVRDVLLGVERVKECASLEQHRHAPTDRGILRLGHPRDLLAVEGDGAAVDLEQSDQHLEHDALALAGAADDRQYLALIHVEVQIPIHDLPPEGLLDPSKFDERHRPNFSWGCVARRLL
jgi:hypothetical protein